LGMDLEPPRAGISAKISFLDIGFFKIA